VVLFESVGHIVSGYHLESNSRKLEMGESYAI